MAVPKSLTIIACLGLSSVSAISFKTFLDPVVNLVNGIQDQRSTPEDEAPLNQEQSLDSTARFLFLNSSSTISASYALFIILAISFALFAGLMLIYLLAGSLFGSRLGGYGYQGNGHGYKRSLQDETEEYNLTKIIEILALMEEEFRRVGGAWVYEEECKKRALCQLTTKTGVFSNAEGQKMAKLVQDLQQATESSHLEANVNHEPALRKASSFIQASQKGQKEGECIRAYPKCSS